MNIKNINMFLQMFYMKLKDDFLVEEEKYKTRSEKEKIFLNFLQLYFTYSFDQTCFLNKKTILFPDLVFGNFLCLLKKCVRIFLKNKIKIIIRVFFWSKKKVSQTPFCWNFFAEGGERNPLENLAQFVLYPLLFWKKKVLSIFFSNVLFSCFCFVFLFLFLFSAQLPFLCVFLSVFSLKKKNRIKWETAWCNGCPADQISDHWTYRDFTGSTTSPHAAVIRRAFNRAKRSSTLEKFLEIKNNVFFRFFHRNLKKIMFSFLLFSLFISTRGKKLQERLGNLRRWSWTWKIQWSVSKIKKKVVQKTNLWKDSSMTWKRKQANWRIESPRLSSSTESTWVTAIQGWNVFHGLGEEPIQRYLKQRICQITRATWMHPCNVFEWK